MILVRTRARFILTLDFTNKRVKVEPALPPLDDEHAKHSLDTYNHVQTLSDDKRMSLYDLEYDKLVISVGCYSASFGIPGVRMSV